MTNIDGTISKVTEKAQCKKHDAIFFQPCFTFPSGSDENTLWGVCGKRIRAAGFNGKISQTSYAKYSRKS